MGDQAMVKFSELYSAAQEACDRGGSTVDFEDEFVALLHFMMEHPEIHDVFEKRFVDDIKGHRACLELIEFCMHTLRYESVRLACEKFVRGDDIRARDAMSRVLEAWADDWANRDLYAFYGGVRD